MKVGALCCSTRVRGTEGAVSLNFARADQVVLSPAKVAGANEITFNFTATEAQIACELRWAPDAQFSGRVNLEDAHVGELEMNLDADGRSGSRVLAPRRAASPGDLTYRRLGEASVKQRLQWIRRQYEGSHPATFAAQPYEQLADMYRQAGQDTEAREVAIARRRDLRKYGNLNWCRRYGNGFLDKTIRYGYQTWRAALGLAAVFVVFLVLSIVGQHQHVIVPLGDVKGLDPVPTATQCTSDYPASTRSGTPSTRSSRSSTCIRPITGAPTLTPGWLALGLRRMGCDQPAGRWRPSWSPATPGWYGRTDASQRRRGQSTADGRSWNAVLAP